MISTPADDDRPSRLPDWLPADPLALSRIRRSVKLGVKSIWTHRLRSFLTMLGIVFGVCSVIAMLAIGEGLSFEAQEQIRRLGSNNIIVRSVKPPEDRSSSAERSMSVEYGITYDDIDRIRNTIPSVEIVMPSRILREDVWRGEYRVDCEVVGTLPWYPRMTNHPVVRGRFFTDSELDAVANVCVLEQGMANELFPIDNPIGRTVRIGSQVYRVVGVMAPKGARISGAGEPKKPGAPGSAQAAAYQMYIPLSAARQRFGELIVQRSSGSIAAEKVELHEATVQVARLEDVLETSEIIRGLLERYHTKKDYDLVVPLGLLQQAERQKQIFNVVLGAIAGISLLVGGIGIMNIMLASVTERTREIGIRRAIGAKRSQIVVQFLIETVVLSTIGGLLGIFVGVSIPIVVTFLAGMPTVVTLWSLLLSVGISMGVGLLFGMYPAARAANLNPIEALRHE